MLSADNVGEVFNVVCVVDSKINFDGRRPDVEIEVEVMKPQWRGVLYKATFAWDGTLVEECWNECFADKVCGEGEGEEEAGKV